MDYPTSPALADRYTALIKIQWELIHNPQSTTGLFDGMEEGALSSEFKGTPVVFLGDTAIRKERLFIYSDTSKTVKVKFETADTSKTKVAFQLIITTEPNNIKLPYPKTGCDTLVFNEIKQIRLDSIPNGKYTLTCKVKVKTLKNKKEVESEKVFTTNFFIRTKKLEITTELLKSIFANNPDTARLGQVARAINKYSEEFGIVNVNRMSHFLGQIGAETGELKNLKEIPGYTQKNIYDNCLKPNLRNSSKSTTGKTFKYCDFVEGYNCLDINSAKCSDDPKNAAGHGDCDSCIPVPFDGNGCTWTWLKFDSLYNIKSSYNGTVIFDYWYGCRMGNGPKSSRDGSTYMGRGFIHLTGKDNYKVLSNEWNKIYPDDKKEFHGKDINLLETDVEIAIKAAMIYWKYKGLNEIADKGTSPTIVEKIGKKVNGGDNGITYRKNLTNSAVNNLK
ncbi:glycoside hydrolase family 19 protein [Tenuifilum thalassicum]|uniref:Glycoside hydrolase family 19 catalytic domain-containing protein n=1 Tax=Tenuifilum thalassicum TaxID=2590900 RepID=A0A7D4BZH6_9BACT|nr:hypothetical protein [Tenuifilum thalassicum]QKG79684.1 hypothetical protein FHG85_05220 [Tenuifilum thalassicum]